MNDGNEPQEFWLFGYGSLIWKPPPFFDKRVPGWVVGYVRRFWQARYLFPLRVTRQAFAVLTVPSSEDHRGTPEAPGRVATLITQSYWAQLQDDHHGPPPDRVWGMAYRIPPENVAEVQDYLDIREVNGYSIHYTAFYPVSASTRDSGPAPPIRCLVYIGTPDNPQFVGPQDPQLLAEHIYRSRGPSGPNDEYLFMLESALDGLCEESGDAHIKDLADRVRAIEGRG